MRTLGLALSLAFMLATVACGGNSTNPTPSSPLPPPSTATPDVRADYLVSQMTLAEKVQLVHGGAALDWTQHTLPRGGAGWIPGIPRLGIPDLYFSDGSVGVGNSVGPATALPSSVASAASWDLNEAAKYGQALGAESRAYGLNVNLGGQRRQLGSERSSQIWAGDRRGVASLWHQCEPRWQRQSCGSRTSRWSQ